MPGRWEVRQYYSTVQQKKAPRLGSRCQQTGGAPCAGLVGSVKQALEMLRRVNAKAVNAFIHAAVEVPLMWVQCGHNPGGGGYSYIRQNNAMLQKD